MQCRPSSQGGTHGDDVSGEADAPVVPDSPSESEVVAGPVVPWPAESEVGPGSPHAAAARRSAG